MLAQIFKIQYYLFIPSKLHSLGWHHKIEVEEGVKKLYEWYLSN